MKVCDIATGEIGYLEKKSLAYLDEKVKNAGSNNYTKYARDLDELHFFNGNKQGYAWCAVFVCWCFTTAYGMSTAQKMLYLPPKSLAASCTYAMNYYKKANRFYKEPKVGDQVFFKSGSSIVHTGIVTEVKDGRIYTVEGNTSASEGIVVANGGGVFAKTYPCDFSRIAGYGRPDYSLVKTEAEEAVEWITSTGIMKGDTSGDLHLDSALTRKQFAVMLYRYNNMPK